MYLRRARFHWHHHDPFCVMFASSSCGHKSGKCQDRWLLLGLPLGAKLLLVLSFGATPPVSMHDGVYMSVL